MRGVNVATGDSHEYGCECKKCKPELWFVNEYAPKLSDDVRAPMHYVNGRSYEPRQVIRDWGLNFNLGNVVKYISRAGRKADEPKLQALEKAIQYLQWEIEAVRIEEQDAK